MTITVSQNTVLLTAAVVTVTSAIIWWRNKKTQSNRIPSSWRKVGEISELLMYPLKSGGGIKLKEAECTPLGLKSLDSQLQEFRNLRDRSFALYNADTRAFVTCRIYPALLLVKTSSIRDGVIQFSAPGVPNLTLKVPSSDPENKKITMWFDEEVNITDCGDEAAQWFRSYVKKDDIPLRLGYYVPNVERRSTDKAPWNKFKKYYSRMNDEYTGGLADLASYMILGEASINELKCRLPPHLQTIPAKQFRPNIVVRGAKPYEEDTWDWIKIGDNIIMRGFKPCTRCTVTTMDPETGVREPHLEPLKTMKKFRQVKEPGAKELDGDAPVMGLYSGLHAGGGPINIGDPVYIGVA